MYEENNLTRVEVIINIPKRLLKFIAIWFIIGLVLNIVFLFTGNSFDNDSPQIIIFQLTFSDVFKYIPLFVFPIGIIQVYATNYWEYKKSEKDLREILDAEIVNKTK